MTASDKELFEFDSFRLDPAEHLLLRDGEPVPLEPKVFETLLVLIRQGRLVGKEELMQAVWPDSFVEESNLTRNISVLRKALNRTDGGPQYIETVPKRGYRFVGEVRAPADERVDLIVQSARVSVVVEEEESGENTTGQEPGAAIERRQSFGKLKRHKFFVALTLALLMTAVAAAVYFSSFSGSGQGIDSLAVLPFINVSADPDTEYLSDGITDSVINSLSQLPRLKVMSRNSVFHYKGRELDAQAAGNQLGVRAVLTGRVELHGDSLSISTELVDARDNSHLWGEQYTYKPSEILVVQEKISRDISEKLRLRLSGAEQSRVTRRYTENPEAYQLYLKGRYFWLKFTPSDHERAADYFNQAIVKDSKYAQAYTGLADTFIASAGNGWIAPSYAYPKAKVAVNKALELDETLAEAHATLGALTIFYDYDWAVAEREFKRGIELNPNFSGSYEIYSQLLMATGRLDEALAMARRGLEVDPLSVLINDDMSYAYYYARRYDEGIAQYQKSLEMDPNDTLALLGLGAIYEQKGMYDEAIGAYQKMINASERTSGNLGVLGHAYAASGRRGEALRILEELKEMSKQKYVSPYDLAVLYTGLDEKDLAIEQLQKEYQERGSGLFIDLKVEPLFDPLRSDPRFADLLRTMGL